MIRLSYTYYKPIESDEHMLFATEIAKLYYDVATPKQIHGIIKRHHDSINSEVPLLYYSTKNGLVRVYSEKIYKPAMDRYLRGCCVSWT